MYRNVVWVKKTVSSGQIYHGTNNVSNLGETSTHGNPYHVSNVGIPVNVWCLIVGYIHSKDDDSTTHLSRL